VVLTSRGGWGVTGRFLWWHSILPCQGGLQTHTRFALSSAGKRLTTEGLVFLRFVTPRFAPVNRKMSTGSSTIVHAYFLDLFDSLSE
jgi:hypothetical protein